MRLPMTTTPQAKVIAVRPLAADTNIPITKTAATTYKIIVSVSLLITKPTLGIEPSLLPYQGRVLPLPLRGPIIF
jgi:hypothetical protein